MGKLRPDKEVNPLKGAQLVNRKVCCRTQDCSFKAVLPPTKETLSLRKLPEQSTFSRVPVPKTEPLGTRGQAKSHCHTNVRQALSNGPSRRPRTPNNWSSSFTKGLCEGSAAGSHFPHIPSPRERGRRQQVRNSPWFCGKI